MPLLIALVIVIFINVCLAILVHRGRRVEPSERVLPDGAAGFLTTEFLAEVANPKRLNTIRMTSRGRERLDVIEKESDEHGIVGVLTICVDPRGVIALKDGHHRLLYALDNGIDILPVAIQQSRGIRSHGRPVNEVLPLLLLDHRVSEPETE